MNILIPDHWLREYLKTKATPEQIKEYLSLCGPSIERIYGTGDETVYDVEVTGNRPDAMSVMGVAREAAAILPRFGVAASLTGDPYQAKAKMPAGKPTLKLAIKTDPLLNPRWTSVVFDEVTIQPSPAWLRHYLVLAGLRSLNNVIDITNFLMHAYGQPAHVFDYDKIVGRTMTLRASQKGEKLVTLDGKSHTLPENDIVIEDGAHKLIDLCGIMGGKNSSVTERTKRVVLFLQTYDATHIRKTSMSLGHRTSAAALFEKGIDTELVKPVFLKGIAMMVELTGGKIASKVTDIYPQPYKADSISVPLSKVHSYIGTIMNKEIKEILSSLGFLVTLSRDTVAIRVPSFRRDVSLDVDIIEEIARVHGYHNIPSQLPSGAPPVVLPDSQLTWEEDVKVRLRDWGYTEIITYSMVSEAQMQVFGQDASKAYKIANPLSTEWEYMRPHLFMSMVPVIRENLKFTRDLKIFELSMTYRFRANDLPSESPTLIVVWGGNKFLEAKGLAEFLFSVCGLTLPLDIENKFHQSLDWYGNNSVSLAEFGSLGELHHAMLGKIGINTPITLLYIDFGKLVASANTNNTYIPVPQYPPVVEDLSFTVPERFHVQPLMDLLSHAHALVSSVTLLDVHQNTRTFHVTYQDPKRNLTGEEIIPIRNNLIKIAQAKFGVVLKNRITQYQR